MVQKSHRMLNDIIFSRLVMSNIRDLSEMAEGGNGNMGTVINFGDPKKGGLNHI